MEAGLKEIAAVIPDGFEWSVGTGTKKSHAQIIDRRFRPIRKNSWYAVAMTEEAALIKAVEQLEADLRRS